MHTFCVAKLRPDDRQRLHGSMYTFRVTLLSVRVLLLLLKEEPIITPTVLAQQQSGEQAVERDRDRDLQRKRVGGFSIKDQSGFATLSV